MARQEVVDSMGTNRVLGKLMNQSFQMAFVHHDHEGFRPGRRSKKQKKRTLSVEDLVLRATEEVTAKRDWLSECRGGSSLLTSTSRVL